MIVSENLNKKITSPECVYKIMSAILKAENPVDQDKEHVWIIGLSTNNTIKYIELVSLGTLNYAPHHAREIFRMAIIKAVNSIIMVHNHPSEDVEPSDCDIKTTKELIKAGEIIGIKLLDHVIIAKEKKKFTSLKKALPLWDNNI